MKIRRRSKPRISREPLPDASEMEDAFTVLKNYSWLCSALYYNSQEQIVIWEEHFYDELRERLIPISQKYNIPVFEKYHDGSRVRIRHPLREWAEKYENKYKRIRIRKEKEDEFRTKIEKKGVKLRKKLKKSCLHGPVRD